MTDVPELSSGTSSEESDDDTDHNNVIDEDNNGDGKFTDLEDYSMGMENEVDEVEGEDIDFDIEVDTNETFITANHETEYPQPHLPLKWTGFKNLADNLDKNVKPSNQQIDQQTKSLHYFHSIAVHNQIDCSSLSDTAPTHICIDPNVLLPTADDLDKLKKEFQILVAR